MALRRLLTAAKNRRRGLVRGTKASSRTVAAPLTPTTPSTALEPAYQSLAASYPDLGFYEVNVDAQQVRTALPLLLSALANPHAKDIANEIGVTDLPTIQLYKSGVKIGSSIGATEEMLKVSFARARVRHCAHCSGGFAGPAEAPRVRVKRRNMLGIAATMIWNAHALSPPVAPATARLGPATTSHPPSCTCESNNSFSFPPQKSAPNSPVPKLSPNSVPMILKSPPPPTPPSFQRLWKRRSCSLPTAMKSLVGSQSHGKG